MNTTSSEASMLGGGLPRHIAYTRFAVSLIQGALLYALYQSFQHKAWPASSAELFSPLLLTALFIPVLVVASAGHVERKRMLVLAVIGTVVVSSIGFYDIWRAAPDGADAAGFLRTSPSNFPSAPVFLLVALWLFIAHSLTLAASIDRRRIALYPTYFEIAWTLAVQVIFSAMFVGVLWLVLWLGAALFMLVKLDFLQVLLGKAWFSIPVTAFAFSSAIHVTDVRPGIVRGIRTLLLVLMSWLLPLATLIVFGFVLSLPWTGMAPLWATRHATAVLLGAAAILVLLINAAYQSGEVSSQIAKVLRWSGRLAALLLVPIVAIAVYSLGLRVADYGWTTERIIAAACLLVAASYAVGYGRAAFARDDWLRQVAPTNVFTAFLVLGVLFALLSPIADPARISVASQLARLEAGKVSVEKFDFDYLRFGGEKYGWEALQKLKVRAGGAEAAKIKERANEALARKFRWDPSQISTTADDLAANVTVWPKGSSLPKFFFTQDWTTVRNFGSLPQCLLNKNMQCDAFLMDFSGGGKTEVLIIGQQDSSYSAILVERAPGKWHVLGSLNASFGGCRSDLRKELRAGSFRFIAPRYRDLEVLGQRIPVIAIDDGEKGCYP